MKAQTGSTLTLTSALDRRMGG